MRLIDADKIVNFRVTASDGKKYVLLPVEKLDDIPTAYDVDKVIERLHYAKNPYSDVNLVQYNNALDLAMLIVKRGGA